MIGLIVGIIFALLALGGIGSGIFFIMKKKEGGRSEGLKDVKSISLIAAGGAFAVLFIFIPFSFHTVDAGEVAVVKHLGEARSVRTAGTYFDFWMTESYSVYDAKVQDLSIVTPAYSNDAQTMDVELTVQYQIDTSKVIEIANTYGSLDILNSRIESVAIDAMKSVMAENTAEQIIQGRAQLSKARTFTLPPKQKLPML